ncbi:MAG: phosphoglucosamine mutase [Lachnospiraceae bacterium]|jgi:phosphoglucosamine mutase|nr:phosphoglucosamine mutase [Lachnospiraceae bacterium]
MGKYFGTDGFRGEANVDLTVHHAFEVGRFLGWYYGMGSVGDGGTSRGAALGDAAVADGSGMGGTSLGDGYGAGRGAASPPAPCRIVIGKDTRRSSYMFEYALAAGITASGADAYLLHVTTTPSVSYVVRTEEFDCGIMISASHNPYYDNGLKLINGNGEKMGNGVIEALERYLDGEPGKLPLARRDAIGRTVDFAAGRNRYIGYLISLATRSFKGMKVALDCANGSASSIAKNVFDALGAVTHVIHNQPDGLNINLGCGSTHIEALRELVLREGCDVGFAYDGDADRCLAVDEAGHVVDGDGILYVCGKYMKEQGSLYNQTVVTTIMSNLGLYKAFDREGISYEKTDVGDKFVYENMQMNGNCLGGEQSGHIIFSKHANTGDGILTSLKLMEVILEKKQTLGKLVSELEIFPQVLRNISVRDKQAVMDDGAVQAAVAASQGELGDAGRILLRRSGTEPLIRVMVEAQTLEICEEHIRRVVATIEAGGHTAARPA